MNRWRVPSTSSTVDVIPNSSEYLTERYCSSEPDAKRNYRWELVGKLIQAKYKLQSGSRQ